MEYCGIDLHAEHSQICILDEDGEVMETLRVRTSRRALERLLLGTPCEWSWKPESVPCSHLHSC